MVFHGSRDWMKCFWCLINRGYYRCSSSKGCLARKQVERNRSDPDMFIVTYTAEHNHPMPTHRNSLAGSTRQKPVTPPAAATTTAPADAVKPSAKPACSSPATSADDELVQQSTSVQSKDLVEDEEDDELGFSDTAVDDDFFMGLEELAEQVTGDCFPDHFSPSFPIPWLANNAATAAGGIWGLPEKLVWFWLVMMHLLNTHFSHLFVFLERERESVEREKKERWVLEAFGRISPIMLCAFVNLTSITESLVEEKRLPLLFLVCGCIVNKNAS